MASTRIRALRLPRPPGSGSGLKADRAHRGPYAFHWVSVLPKDQKWTGQYCLDDILPEKGALREARDRRKLMVHADNANPHVAQRVKQYLHENGLKSTLHAPYSPDLAPIDLFLFSHVKRMLQGTEFQTAEEPLAAVV
jgi:hypothetical protein